MKVIYNDCYGAFEFSEAFHAEYKTRTGHVISERRFFVKGSDCIRVDPVAVALLEEKGAEWSSGPTANLAIYEFPDVFAGYWEVEEYSGNETVHIQLADAIADVFHTYMEVRCAPALLEAEAQYRRLMEAHKTLTNPLTPPAATPVKESSEVVTHTDVCGGYSYFSA